MTSTQNQVLEARPNVLHDQTIPNTLGGLKPPSPVVRPRLPMPAIMAVIALILVALAIVLGRSA